MKILLYVIELILYIGLFTLISICLYKKLHIKKINKIIIIVLIDFFSVFPIFSGIDYVCQLNNQFMEFMACTGFILSYFYIVFFILFLLYLLISLIFNKLSKDKKISLYNKIDRIVVLSLIGILSVTTCISGYLGSIRYEVNTYEVEHNQLNGLKIVTLADIHYGTTCSTLNKNKLVKKVNDLNPDIIFLVGDIFDNHIENLDKNDFTTFIDSFKATYGSYAVLGNHEFKQNTYENAISFYSDVKNCKLLLDEEVIVDNKIRVAGRIDYVYKQRKDLKDIVSTNSTLPLIVLDHQPNCYKEAKDVGALIQYSGHTHNGQIVPYDIAVNLYFEIKYQIPAVGHIKKDNFNLMITRGASNWGFPYKNAGASEILVTKEK